MEKIISNSVLETKKLAQAIGEKLKSGDVIAFEGGLGAGKTTFVSGLEKALNLKGEICSPTYSLVNEYFGDINLYHFDMYRINSIDDLYLTGFFDYLESGSIIVIEWSENIKEYLPPQTIKIKIEVLDENKRCFEINGDERFENISN